MTNILAWHFVGEAIRDGQPIPPDGEWLVHVCESGLHASRRALDALRYAPGDTACRVECKDIVAEESDKFVCRQRRILWRVDATDVLHAFARYCALDVIHLWDAPDVVRKFLETGDEGLREDARTAIWAAINWGGHLAARNIARKAAWNASLSTARSSVPSVAWPAACTAAQATAHAAARAAARDAGSAWYATYVAKLSEYNTKLETMLHEARERTVK